MALEPFKDENQSFISVWNWLQRFGVYQIYKRKRISVFVIFQIRNEHFWLWIATEPIHHLVLGIYISEEEKYAYC